MRTREEAREFAQNMFMLGQIETKANTDWANDFAISIREYVVKLFCEGVPDNTIQFIDGSGNVFFEAEDGDTR